MQHDISHKTMHFGKGSAPQNHGHTPFLFGSRTASGRASRARVRPPIERAAAAMSLTGKPMPEFFVKVLPADGAAPERVSASSLVRGTPTVIHFYNSG